MRKEQKRQGIELSELLLLLRAIYKRIRIMDLALNNITDKVNALIAAETAESKLLTATHQALLDAIAANAGGDDGPLNALAAQLDTEIARINANVANNQLPAPQQVPAPAPDPAPAPAPVDTGTTDGAPAA